MPGEALTTDRIRVLWLIKGLGPGGAEQLLVNQARVRDTDHFDYRAAYLVPWKDHRVEALKDAGIPVVALDGPRDADPRWMWRLRKLLRDEPVDVIHNHSPLVASITRLMVLTLPRDKRPALVYTEHNRWPRHNRYTRLANRATYRLDDEQVAVSDDVIETIPASCRGNISPLVHGIVLDETRAKAGQRVEVRRELRIGDEEVVIGIVANFRKEKDYPTLLEAARIALDKTDVPLRFVSVGQGPLEQEMRELHQELGLGDRFLILGYQPDAVRVMAAFDLFTLSSLHEGLPVSLMDALALGQPAVATEVGGVPQAVTDGSEGLLVAPQRPDLLAQAFLELVSDPRRRAAMSEAAVRRAEMFDIRTATAELERLYTRAARQNRSEHDGDSTRPPPKADHGAATPGTRSPGPDRAPEPPAATLDGMMQRSDDALWRLTLDGVIVLAADGASPLSLQGPAADAWLALDQATDLKQLSGSLAALYDVDPQTVEDQIKPIVQELIDNRLVVAPS